MKALLGLAVAAVALAGSVDARADADPISGAQTLAPVFRALSEVKSGRRQAPVNIIQIGDSHSANDYITGALRDRLQFAFGHGGRGVLPPGLPYRGFDARLVQVSQSDSWRVDASFAPPPNPAHPDQPRIFAAPPPFGLAGYRLTGEAGARMTMDAESGARFTRASVCALAGPGAGAITLTAGGTSRRFALAARLTQPVCHSLTLDAPQQRLELSVDGGSVSVLSWATFADAGGVTLSNLGVPGTQLKDFAARDDAVLAAEFEAYRPDLIILAYGVNEGYVPAVDFDAYEALLREQLRRLKRLTHGAPILVLGAPDAETLRPDLYGSGGTFPRCAPLSDEEARDYPRLIARHSPDLARWYPPAGLEMVRAAQRRAAAAEGAAFWDWSARMGGPCSAHLMSLADPRLVRGDHIHFTVEGGIRIADLLFGDLMRAAANDHGGR